MEREREREIKRLALNGGGVRGFTFLGALKALEDKEIIKFENIEEFIGTSIGSITSVMISISYSPLELFEYLKDFNISELQDIRLERLTTFYGIDSGNNIIKFIKELLKKKDISEDITLKELYQLTKKKVTIVTTCLTDQETVYLNYETYPDLKVYHAIRLSIGVPLIFTCAEYKGKRYTDGSVSMDYPMRYYDNENRDIDEALGIAIMRRNIYSQNDTHEIESIEDFVKSIFNCFMKKINKLEVGNYKDRTIVIDTGEHSSFDFNMSLENKQTLYNLGYSSVLSWISSSSLLSLSPDNPK